MLPSRVRADQKPELNRAFQTALAEYNSGHFTEAATQLQTIARRVPNSFDVQELLGMTYSAQSQFQQAVVPLRKAAQLNPRSAAAHTNLAADLVHLGKLGPAEAEFKSAVTLAPQDYDCNHNLGEFYIAAEKIQSALPFLEKAQRLKPAAYDNGYDLSLAYLQTGRTEQAEREVHDLLQQKDTAELHNLLAQIEEKNGKFVAAENEYQTAAHMEPSESNLFDWGSELLLHRTLDPAVQVFEQAVGLYPKSPRLAIGLGMALYSRGNYDRALNALLKAADLNPSDPRCYYFLYKAYDSSPGQADEVIQRFHRFTELQPHNAQALYYYAMSLWKKRRLQGEDINASQIESLLKQSLEIEPDFSDARFQLANLYSDQKHFAEAVPQYEKALQKDPSLAEGHYRLGQAYVHTGQKEQAEQQFQVYQRLRAEHLAELDKQRSEIRQFIYSSRQAPGEKPGAAP